MPVRVATENDLARLTELLQACIAETPTARGGYLSGYPRRFDEPLARLSKALASEALFAGTVDDYIVGVALTSIDETMPNGPLAIVEELYVEPEAREVGVGEDLLDACVQWARSRNCTGIDVKVLPGARSAKNLAERSGLTARLLVLHRDLRQ